jgi:NAD(P)-dependent dehydrogenase (short-subunit alcohol dehydrogenase family)
MQEVQRGRLEGKVALITGGGNGIGRVTAQLFAKEGASVVITDKIEAAAHETARLLTQAGGKAIALTVDVTNAAEMEASVRQAVETFGKLNILINNAGLGSPTASIPNLSVEDWDLTMNVNVKGVFFGLKYAIPAIIAAGGGSIVNLASVAGIVGTPGMAAYGASKAAVIQLTKTAALENATKGVRVNAVCPAWTKTNLVDQLVAQARHPENAEERLVAGVPLGRLGQPSEIAQAILYLASDESSFVTGTALTLDGGLTAQ